MGVYVANFSEHRRENDVLGPLLKPRSDGNRAPVFAQGGLTRRVHEMRQCVLRRGVCRPGAGVYAVARDTWVSAAGLQRPHSAFYCPWERDDLPHAAATSKHPGYSDDDRRGGHVEENCPKGTAIPEGRPRIRSPRARRNV